MITVTFLTNFILGLAFVTEFGQLNIEILRRGLRYGFKQALLTSWGGIFADFIYLNITITGVLFVFNRPEILQVLWFVGGLVLLYIATRGFIDYFRAIELTMETRSGNPFIVGFLLNFIHPTNFIWWITILSSIIITDTQKNSIAIAYANSTGILFGGLVGTFILALFSVSMRRYLSVSVLQRIGMGSSVVLFGFSAWFFYNALTL